MAEFDELTSAGQNVQQAGQTLQGLSGGSAQLMDSLFKTMGERIKSSPVVKEQATARAGLLSAGPEARAGLAETVQGGQPLSPNAQQAILAQKKASALIPLLIANRGYNVQFGGLQDIIDSATRGYQAQVEKAQTGYQTAQGSFQNILSQLAEQRAGATEQRTAESHFPDLERRLLEAQIYKTQKGADDGRYDPFKDLFNQLQPTQQIDYSSQPAYSPSRGAGTIDGDWYFDGSEWIPIVD